MGIHSSSGLGSKAIKTFDLLDQIVTVLGGTKLSFYPILSGFGTEFFPYGSGSDGVVMTTASALESAWDPKLEVGGVLSIYMDSSASLEITAADNAAYSFAAAAFSLGIWVMPTEALGTERVLLSKWDETTAAEAREWEFRFDTSGNLELVLYDESANASETGTAASQTLTPFVWNFCVATFDGVDATPSVHLYTNATDGLSGGTTTEAGAFVSMEDLATTPRIGGSEATGGAVEHEFEGRFALPFICGKELTGANVTTIYNIGRILLGLA